MHSDHSPSSSSDQPPPDPALEARIVAWVLGEASPAEAAELARLCAEQPALGKFRRRIAETNELLAEAAKPAPASSPEFRLAPERRAALLAALTQAPLTAPPAPTAFPPPAVLPSARAWLHWILPAAACLALLGLLAAIMIPTVEYTFGVDLGPSRPVPSEIALGASAPATSANTETTIILPQAAQTAGDGHARVDFNLGASSFGSDGASPPPPPAPVSTAPAPTAAPISGAPRLEFVAAETRRRHSLRNEAQKQSEPEHLSVTLDTQLKSDYVFRDAGPPVAGFLGAKDEWTASASVAGESAPSDGAFAQGEIRLNGATVSGKESLAYADDADALHALKAKGRTQFTAGALDEAQETFRTLETIDSDNAEARYFLGRIAEEKTRAGILTREKLRAAKIGEVAKGWQRPGVFVEDAAQPQLAAPETEADTESKPDSAKPAPRPAPDASLRLETPAADNAVSTFSLHVSDASFRLARAALARGEFPDPASVRPEEFYNAFDYGDPAPLAGEAIAARVEQSAHPFLQQRNLLRVALRVPAAGRAAGQPLRLTLLLDTSGSMEREDRAATVRRALEQLAALLGPADRVTLVGFARTPRLLADRLPGDQAGTLAEIAADTPPEGGTNLEEALKLAADLALRQFDSAAQNRVVLLTDGAANLGDADPVALAARVVQLRRQGVAFDACGIGARGLDDGVLEALTRQGDGRYLLLDQADEAGPAFARQLAGAFRPAAQNVKVQIRFNPARVPRYRLIGFEQHRLREQDFRDDQIDAAELASAEAAVALYQIEADPQGSGELGEVFVRFRETATGRMIERSWPLPYDAAAPAFDRASPSLQLAGSAALLAEKLRGGDLAAQIRLADLDPVAATLRAQWAGQPRVAEFLDMLAQARRLAPE